MNNLKCVSNHHYVDTEENEMFFYPDVGGQYLFFNNENFMSLIRDGDGDAVDDSTIYPPKNWELVFNVINAD